MDRKTMVLGVMFATCLGAILSMVGTFVASGLDQGGSWYNTLSAASMVFWVLFLVAFTFHPDFSKTKKDQSEVESDSSLL